MATEINYTTEKELEEDFEQYATIALSNGFSKGTANVSSADMKKLHGLLSHYRKQAHPFTACVRDNRKRFGPLTEKYCAVLKDLIEGNTHWRNSKKKNLSEETLKELYALDLPDGFLHALSEWEPGVFKDEEDKSDIDLADILWDRNKGFRALEEKINAVLNEDAFEGGSGDSELATPYMYWVRDLTDSRALVCHGGSDYYVVPFSMDKIGDIEIADESEWVKVEEAWVNSNEAYLSERETVAEVFLAGSEYPVEEKDGLFWKVIAKEGKWKYSPGPGQKPIPRPLTFTPDGKSSKEDLIISIKELKDNFDSGAKQYVTVPLTHEDNVLDNTGFVRDMKIDKDENGLTVLKAGIEFTEPEVKEKVIRGSIADISSGIHFDYIKKDSGTKYNAIIGHTALTNNPWLNGMTPFLNASENMDILAFSEEENVGENSQPPLKGGDTVEVTEESAPKEEEKESVQPTFLSELGISEDEAKARLSEYTALKAEQKKGKVEARCHKWQEEGVSPALVLAAKAILEADEGAIVLNLSEEGNDKALTATDIVERLVAAAPHVNLTEDKVTDKDVEGQAPPNTTDEENSVAKLSLAEKAIATQLMFEAAMSEEDAIAEAKRLLGKDKE